MTYEVLKEMRVKTSQGDKILSPGKIINLDESKASNLITAGKIKAIVLINISEERRQSLLECITATWETLCHPLYRNGFWMTDEIHEAEARVDEMQDNVLCGQLKLADFSTACLLLVKAIATSKPKKTRLI